ncbi:MAG: beta-1,3-galactosyltransferase [uncultured bacterium]|nr:MAG: beta-1,3-galactosyltransferase [uncultured bacterium]
MSEENSLVSVIIPTKNSARTLEKCLESIKNQSYKNIELIVVDNNSTDNTKEIAEKFNCHSGLDPKSSFSVKVFNFGPERSAQRNFGVKNSNGEYVIIIDSDMELDRKVIKSCVEKMQPDTNITGIIIPEESFGEGFWAQCKKLERSFYVGVEWMEAARFFKKNVYVELGGYNIEMTSGEDWDLSQRIEQNGKIGRINDYIFHNEGDAKLLKIIKKKFFYARNFSKYKNTNLNKNKISKQTGILNRYKLFFSNPKKLFKNPIIGFGMLFMKTCEFGLGGLSYITTINNN